MKKRLMLLATAALLAELASPALAYDRYAERPPVVVSPDLSAPWVLQLGRSPAEAMPRQQRRQAVQPRARQAPPKVQQRTVQQQRSAQPRQPKAAQVQTAALRAPEKRTVKPQINPIYLPQMVAYDGGEKPGTIIIDTNENFLYHVQADGQARRYGVGTGKPGFEWSGTHKVTSKREWPDWRPPAEMIARERAKGRVLPAMMVGGPENPLGARALYLGSTLYRIHGTNQPWTIGGAVSSGCIRMRNEDVMDLYERVAVGTKVIVR
ncbi:L,D-transpeptidase [Aminobacter sp. P9b]|uniref:Lipoprotein-anchoring transpeptidase ErfK/SrfK n=1 Tax=Aminobacter niigataensis TaxID=83265 RepID=A0ABR6L5Q3_9HYPH|nr:L,D-transpeptidase [Aminobacter niigataensis]MBB4652103.1 lipoprotein-anchoring transpeptidase ErfK/SrfK [Aminobacter niigataensis]CAI2935920.1 Putative L,D-transpeptidase YbiS [Aminobacter niigataensis]